LLNRLSGDYIYRCDINASGAYETDTFMGHVSSICDLKGIVNY